MSRRLRRGAQRWIGPATRFYDLQGATVVPVLPTRIITFWAGARELTFNLEAQAGNLLAQVKERAAAAKPGDGSSPGWIETSGSAGLPTRADSIKFRRTIP